MKRRWQKERTRVDRADDWLMTYADMITLLLCFFVLFTSALIYQRKNTPKVGVEQHIIERPAPQEAKAVMVRLLPPDSDEIIRSEFPELVKEEKTESPESHEPMAASVPDTPLERIRPPTSLPEIVDNLKSWGMANLELKGDRITSLEISSAAFFDRGSATLSPAGKNILHDVAGNLKAEKFRDYQITVEGHTDDAPINTSLFPSNWELSTARAAAVVRFFLDEGISAQKLRAAGYADTFPKAANRNAHGDAIPENQAQNRRVVIKLEKIEKAT
jgi:chemotaxis protein MotB